MTFQSIRAAVDDLAVTYAGSTFLTSADKVHSLAYDKLPQRAAFIGKAIAEFGVEQGDKVAVLLDNGFFTAELLISLFYCGFVAVPLNPNSGPESIRLVLEHSEAKLLIASHEMNSADLQLPIELPVLLADSDDGFLKGTVGSGEAPYTLPASSSSSGGHEAFLIYTSGTTGRPKGVVLSHANLLAGARNSIDAHDLASGDKALCVLPLYHLNAPVITLLATLLTGGTVVIPRRFQAQTFWKWVAEHRCTWFSLVPDMVAQLLESQVGTTDLEALRKHVRFARTSSAPLSPEMHKRFERDFGMVLVEAMGSSEAGGAIFSNPADPARRKIGSVGVAWGFEIKFIDGKEREVAPGTAGELVIRGPSVMSAYYRDAELTKKAFTSDGWLRTGDEGYADEDGFVFLMARTADLINKSGEKIYPREIELVLSQHPAVAEAVVAAIPDAFLGQDIAGCVVLREGHSSSVNQLQAFCRDELGLFKTPRHLRIVDRLPRNSLGKVQRRVVGEMLTASSRKQVECVVDGARLAGRDSAADGTGRADGTNGANDTSEGFLAEEFDRDLSTVTPQVLSIWNAAFKRSDIQTDDNFFALGGHSFLAFQILFSLQQEFSVELSFANFCRLPTVAQQAHWIACSRSSSSGLSWKRPERKDADGVPLSLTQEAIWLRQIQMPDCPLFNEAEAVTIRGPLNLSAFSEALQTLRDRHESLRMRIDTVGGVPRQFFPLISEPWLEVIDIADEKQSSSGTDTTGGGNHADTSEGATTRGANGADTSGGVTIRGANDAPASTSARLKALLEQELRRPFVQGQPLARSILVRSAENEHTYLMVLHHLVCDRSAIGIFVRELSRLYKDACSGTPNSMPQLKAQFGDYCLWERSQLESGRLDEHASFWIDHLRGSSLQLEFPTDRPTALLRNFDGASCIFHLDIDSTLSLRKVASRHSVSLFAVLAATLSVLINRYTGQSQIVLPIMLNNRNRSEFESMIGPLADACLMKVDVDGDFAFGEFVSQVQKRLMVVYAHREAPLHLVLKRMSGQGLIERFPSFDVVLNYTEASAGIHRLELGNLQLEPIPLCNGKTKYPIVFALNDDDDRIRGDIRFSTELFDVQTIEKLCKQFQSLLEHVGKSPGNSLSSLMTEAEARDVSAVESNRGSSINADESAIVGRLENPERSTLALTDAKNRSEAVIHERFLSHVRQTPDAVSLICQDLELTYSQLNELADGLAAALATYQISRGDVVGICMERSIESIVAMLAVLKLGAAYLPLDPTYPPDRLTYMADDAAAEIVICSRSTSAGLSCCCAKPVCIDELEFGLSRAKSVAIDKRGKPSFTDSVLTAESLNASIVRGSIDPSEPDHRGVGLDRDESIYAGGVSDLTCNASDLAYVMYTSGSTGQPKGVEVLHGGVTSLVSQPDFVDLGPSQRLLHLSSQSFDASTFEVWGALLNGGCCVLVPHMPPLPELGRIIASSRVSTMWLTASFFNYVIDECPEILLPVRQLLIGGEALSVSHVVRAQKALPDTQLINGYGPTESTTFACCYRIPRPFDSSRASVPIGKPVCAREVYILDQNMNQVASGVSGEIYIAGAGLARGYRNQDALTDAAFVTHRFEEGGLSRTCDPTGLDRMSEPSELDPTSQATGLGRTSEPTGLDRTNESIVPNRTSQPTGLDHARETASNLTSEPTRLYRTGDRARYLPGGEIEFLGRLDDQIKLRGYRIELSEIEHAIRSFSGVLDGRVVLRDDLLSGPALCAYVVARNSSALTPQSLKSHLQSRLPPYMVPRYMEMLGRLPINANGKLDARSLPVPSQVESTSCGNPRNSTEVTAEYICGIFAELLNYRNVGSEDSFFDLGGHSLLALKLTDQLTSMFDVEVHVTDLVHNSTPKQLSELIQQRRWSYPQDAFGTTRSLFRLKKGGSLPPLFLTVGGEGGEAGMLAHARMANHLNPEQPVWGLRARGSFAGSVEHTTVEEMARDYIEEIKELQPEGPYYLAGGCIGGLVAYEMARQLTERGDRIALLLLLDARTLAESDYFDFQARWFCSVLRHRLDEALGPDSSSRLDSSQDEQEANASGDDESPASATRNKALNFKRLLRNGLERLIPIDKQKAPAMPRVPWKKYNTALVRFRPRPSCVKATLILSDSLAETEVANNWKRLAGGGVETLYVHGDHSEFLREHRERLGTMIDQLLERARQNEKVDVPASLDEALARG